MSLRNPLKKRAALHLAYKLAKECDIEVVVIRVFNYNKQIDEFDYYSWGEFCDRVNDYHHQEWEPVIGYDGTKHRMKKFQVEKWFRGNTCTPKVVAA